HVARTDAEARRDVRWYDPAPRAVVDCEDGWDAGLESREADGEGGRRPVVEVRDVEGLAFTALSRERQGCVTQEREPRRVVAGLAEHPAAVEESGGVEQHELR